MFEGKKNYLKIFLIALAFALVAVVIFYAIKIRRESAMELIPKNEAGLDEKKTDYFTFDQVRESLEKVGADMNTEPISPEDVRKNLKNVGAKEDIPAFTAEEVRKSLEEAINKQ